MKILNGKPLLWYTIQKAKYIEEQFGVPWIVSTDCPITFSYALMLGASPSRLRPSKYSQSSTSTAQSICYHLDVGDITQSVDLITILQPTSPFTSSHEINTVFMFAEKFCRDCHTSGLVTVKSVPTHLNAYWQYCFTQETSQLLSLATGPNKAPITRRQDLPATFYRSGSIYMTTPSLIQEGLILGKNPVGVCVDEMSYHVNIDTPYDWNLACQHVRNFCFTNR